MRARVLIETVYYIIKVIKLSKNLLKTIKVLFIEHVDISHHSNHLYSLFFFLNSNQLYCSKHINNDQNMKKYILISQKYQKRKYEKQNHKYINGYF